MTTPPMKVPASTKGTPMLASAKLALHQAMRERGLSNVALARELGLLEGEVRRMLDIDRQTKIRTIERAVRHMGLRMASEVRRAA